MTPRGAVGAEPERATGNLKVVHEDQQVGGGLEHADADARDAALGDTRALAASERGEPPARDERVGEPEARIVPGRRVLWPRVAEANHGAQASALFAALGLLDFLRLLALGGRRRAASLRVGLGARFAAGRRLAFRFFALAHLADQLGLGDLGRRLGGG